MTTAPLTSLSPVTGRAEILRLPLEDARSDDGYHALQVAEILGLSVPELATYLDRDPAGLRRNPTSAKLQLKLGRLAALADVVILSENREYLRHWLRAPNPAMRYRVPLQRLLEEPQAADLMIEQIVSVLSGQGQ